MKTVSDATLSVATGISHQGCCAVWLTSLTEGGEAGGRLRSRILVAFFKLK